MSMFVVWMDISCLGFLGLEMIKTVLYNMEGFMLGLAVVVLALMNKGYMELVKMLVTMAGRRSAWWTWLCWGW